MTFLNTFNLSALLLLLHLSLASIGAETEFNQEVYGNLSLARTLRQATNTIPKSKSSKAKKQDQYFVFPPGYNKFKLPRRSGDLKPLELDLYLGLKKVLDFDELEEQITFEVELILSWTDFKILDFRIKETYDNKPGKPIENMTLSEINNKRRVVNDPSVLNEIWRPNLFFERLVSSHQPFVMTKTVKLKVVPEAGYVQYAARFSITTDCAMEFKYYPADTQRCEFAIRLYSYTSNLARLKWHKNEGPFLEDTTLQGYDVRIDNLYDRYQVDDFDDPSSAFHVVCFTVYVRRQVSYHMVQTYLASAFYIVITCLCFILPTRLIEARIAISMTTLLTLTAMFGSVRTSTPLTSYVKAIDIWMVCCIFFVFLTLIQFTFYTWLRAAKEERLKHEAEIKAAQALLAAEGSKGKELGRKSTGTLRPPPTLFKHTTLEKFEAWAFVIDKFSFPIFLSIFVLFSILYWRWLVTSSDYSNWTVNESLNKVDDASVSSFID